VRVEVVRIENFGAESASPWMPHSAAAAVYEEPDPTRRPSRALAPEEPSEGIVCLAVERDEEWLRTAEGYVPLMGLHRVHPANQIAVVGGSIPFGQERVNRWWGLPHDYEPADLTTIPQQFTTELSDRRYLLRKDVVASLSAMLEAARVAGIDVRAGSTYRPWSVQKGLYDGALLRSGWAQRYSAPPGHSEHQLGTAADFTDPAMKHFVMASFGLTPEYQWLRDNAPGYGWRQSYLPTNSAETGYIPEPWHWRFVGNP
jgi:hypothetical protein